MCAALRAQQVDAALVLTEGLLKDMNAGNKASVVLVYVSSPLVWGVHVSGKSGLSNPGQLQGKTAAISRLGSGSHLMASVLADVSGLSADGLKYEVVGNLEGARKALAEGNADYFIWEKYTTKPLVDAGEFKRIGECPTPWPCFVLAANTTWSDWPGLPGFLKLLREKTHWVKNSEEAIPLIASKYGLKPGDVKEWRDQTQWLGMEWTEALRNEIIEKMKYYQLIQG